MIAEAIDTVITLGWALCVWIVLLALTVTVALYAVGVGVWCAGRTVWTLIGRAHSQAPAGAPRGASCGSRDAGTPERAAQRRSRPSWAVEQPIDIEEAA